MNVNQIIDFLRQNGYIEAASQLETSHRERNAQQQRRKAAIYGATLGFASVLESQLQQHFPGCASMDFTKAAEIAINHLVTYNNLRQDEPDEFLDGHDGDPEYDDGGAAQWLASLDSDPEYEFHPQPSVTGPLGPIGPFGMGKSAVMRLEPNPAEGKSAIMQAAADKLGVPAITLDAEPALDYALRNGLSCLTNDSAENAIDHAIQRLGPANLARQLPTETLKHELQRRGPL